MKKVVALLLIGSLAAVFALSGCGSKEEVIEDIGGGTGTSRAASSTPRAGALRSPDPSHCLFPYAVFVLCCATLWGKLPRIAPRAPLAPKPTCRA